VQVFERDCLIPLGTCLAPVGQGKPGDTVAEVRVARSGAPEQTVTLQFGELVRRDLPQGATARLTVTPERRFDCGAGFGKELDTEVVGGVVGLLLDARGRPLVRATDPSERQRQAAKWLGALGLPTGEGD